MHDFEGRAAALYEAGYNCAQAVFLPFAEAKGMDTDTALRASSSLGGGLGHLGEVCGAVLGMVMALGLHQGYSAADADTKAAHSLRTKALVDAFRAHFGATGCDALREVGNRARCTAYVRYAAALAAKAIEGS